MFDSICASNVSIYFVNFVVTNNPSCMSFPCTCQYEYEPCDDSTIVVVVHDGQGCANRRDATQKAPHRIKNDVMSSCHITSSRDARRTLLW